MRRQSTNDNIMKIEVMEKYPDEIKDYVKEYNLGVEHKDINMVNTAIISLVQFLFSPDSLNRQASMHVLDQIGMIQPGFLKSAVKTLLVRYNGEIGNKSIYAGAALKGIFIGKVAEKLIEDQEILQKLKAEKAEDDAKAAQQEDEEAKLVEKIKESKFDLEFLNTFPDIKSIGQYYNNSLMNNQEDTALETLNSLVDKIFTWEKDEPSKFMPGSLLLSKICSKQYRMPFVQDVVNRIQKEYMGGSKENKNVAEKILFGIINDAFDLLDQNIANEIKNKVRQREKERLEKHQDAREKADKIKKLKVPVSIGWSDLIKDIANDYNEGIISPKQEKIFDKVQKTIRKSLLSKKDNEWEHAVEFFSILISKNPDLTKNIVEELFKKENDENISIILQTIVDDIEKNQWADNEKIQSIKTAKNTRLSKEKEEMDKLKEEHERIKLITIAVDTNWNKKLFKTAEDFNEYILEDDKNKIQKLIDNEMKNFIFAKDEEIRRQGQQFFLRIAKKYPKYLGNVFKEQLVPFYMSEHEERDIAVDLFGLLFENKLTEELLREDYPEVLDTLPDQWAHRKQEIENSLLQNKIDAIKADVTQLRISDDWDKKIQKISTQYNKGIKNKEKKDILEAIKEIVDMHMNEKNDERKNQATKVIGLIAKKNIELIQPTIQMFLQLIDNSNNDNEKTRAIIGLGEVTKQRPGWAYFGIEKLVELIQNDPQPDYRRKAMLELSKIGKKNPTMLIEHVDPILHALNKDEDKNVRRIAAMALGNMADALPIEADKVLPALRDALHDEYILVRKFADRALTELRKVMR